VTANSVQAANSKPNARASKRTDQRLILDFRSSGMAWVGGLRGTYHHCASAGLSRTTEVHHLNGFISAPEYPIRSHPRASESLQPMIIGGRATGGVWLRRGRQG